MDENGSSDKRRKFADDLPYQYVPDEWIEDMLSYLYKHHNRAFGEASLHAMGIHPPVRGRPRVRAEED